MRLVELTFIDGTTFYVNPEKVAHIQTYKKWSEHDETPVPATNITFSERDSYIISGHVEDIREKLTGAGS